MKYDRRHCPKCDKETIFTGHYGPNLCSAHQEREIHSVICAENRITDMNSRINECSKVISECLVRISGIETKMEERTHGTE
jgi:hypothetical protein